MQRPLLRETFATFSLIARAAAVVPAFFYSGLQILALFGLDVTSSFVRVIEALWPLLVFPTALLAFLSVRWATVTMWLFLLAAVGRCCGWSVSRWWAHLTASYAEIALLMAVLLTTLSYVFSSSRIGAEAPPGQPNPP